MSQRCTRSIKPESTKSSPISMRISAGTCRLNSLHGWLVFRSTNGLLMKDSSFIGILHDDPSITAPEKCRYDACLIVDQNLEPDDALTSRFRGGRYVMYDFAGTPSDVDPAWDRVYGEFVINSGCLAD